MLLPDNIHPELTIYYNGAIILTYLKSNKKQSIMELFESVRIENEMSLSTFMLSLDWLYLIDVARINANGWVEVCL